MTNILSGRWVFDSNLLVYFLDNKSPFYSRTKEIFLQLLSGNFSGVVAQQNIVDAGAVLIKTSGFAAQSIVKDLESLVGDFNFEVITPTILTYLTYHKLITRMEKTSVDFFDFYLAATMIDNKIINILTVNDKDFSEIKNINAVNPFKI